MGKIYARSTVSNAAVRNILSEISLSLFDDVSEEYLEEAAKYFNYKCPYTGADLEVEIKSKNFDNIEVDHIYSINKDSGGLNVRGNMVYVRKGANSSKSDKPYDVFLNEYGKKNGIPQSVIDSRIKKIQEFQKDYNYDHELISSIILDDIQEIYEEVKLAQEKYIKKIISKINKSTLKTSSNSDLLNFLAYLEKLIDPASAYSYVTALKKLLIVEGLTLKDLDTKNGKIDELIKDYSKKGSKYNPKDHDKTINALRKYAEYKGIIIYNVGKKSKKIKTSNIEYDFKMYLTTVASNTNIQKRYFNLVLKVLKDQGLDFITITPLVLDDLIKDYSAGGKMYEIDNGHFIQAALNRFKEFLSII